MLLPKLTQILVSDQQKKEFREDPAKYLAYRKEVENELNRRFKLVTNDPYTSSSGMVRLIVASF
jgi:hypothetical protein